MLGDIQGHVPTTYGHALKLTLPCSDAERFATVPELREAQRYIDDETHIGRDVYIRERELWERITRVAAEACSNKRSGIMRVA